MDLQPAGRLCTEESWLSAPQSSGCRQQLVAKVPEEARPEAEDAPRTQIDTEPTLCTEEAWLTSPRDHAGAQEKPVDRIRLLSWNVGLLRLRIGGSPRAEVFANPPHSDERLPFLPAAILSTSPDIVALQECYEEAHFNFIRDELAPMLPHSARVKSGGCTRFHNGLNLFSRFPITEVTLTPYRQAALLEQLVASKSQLEVTLEVPGVGKVKVVNIHTTAGGSAPEAEGTDAIREDEIDEAVAACNYATRSGACSAVIIIGDLNAGPEASVGNYRHLLAKGWRDAWVAAKEAGACTGPQYTWDPANFLNSTGPHASCPGQRCDHVFLRSNSTFTVDPNDVNPRDELASWAVEHAQVLFTEPTVALPNGSNSTMSDHHGLLVDIVRPPPVLAE